MITIFNGRRRAPGRTDPDIYIQVSVALRSELHRFWNGRNGNAYLVFSALALHANQDGWAWPSFDLLRRETGISREETVSAALKWLLQTEIDRQPVLRVYRRLDGGKFVGNVYHLFPAAGGEPPALAGTLVPWEPDPDQPGPVQAAPAEAGPIKQNQTLEAEPISPAATLPPLHITVPEGAPAYRQHFTCRCQHCGATVTQAADRCPGCETPVVWHGSRAADDRAKRRQQQAVDEAARARRAAEQFLTPLTAEILGLARADSVKERHGLTLTYRADTREEQRLAEYERAFGAATVRQLAHQARRKAKGKGMIIVLLNLLEAYVPRRPARPTVWDKHFD